MVPSAKFAERKFVYPPGEPFGKPDERVDEGGGQATAEELADAPHEQAVDRISLNVCKGDKLRLVI